MQEVDDLIETLEILRDAVWAKDSEKGFEAVSIFLVQFMDVFGHDDKIFSTTFPILEKLKDHVQSEDFEEANPIVLALLAKLRSVNSRDAG